MSTTLKKTGARLGGLTAALLFVGTMGVSGVSASSQSCVYSTNPHTDCDPGNVPSEEEMQTSAECAPAGAAGFAGGINGALAGYYGCLATKAVSE